MLTGIEIVFGSLKKSLSPKLWLSFFAVFLIFALLSALLIGVLLVPAIVVFLVLGLQLVSFVVWAIIAVSGLLLLLYLVTVLHGTLFFLVRGHIEQKKISLREAIDSALPRATPMLGATILLGLFFAVVFALLMLPVLSSLAGAVSALSSLALVSPEAFLSAALSHLAGILLLGSAMLAVFLLFFFLVLPFTILVFPLAAFEEVSAFGAIKKSFFAVKQNYLQNLASVFFFVVAAIALGIVLGIVGFVLFSVFLFFGATAALAERIVVSLIAALWTIAFSAVFIVNYSKENDAFTLDTAVVAPAEQKASEQSEPTVVEQEVVSASDSSLGQQPETALETEHTPPEQSNDQEQKAISAADQELEVLSGTLDFENKEAVEQTTGDAQDLEGQIQLEEPAAPETETQAEETQEQKEKKKPEKKIKLEPFMKKRI